MLKFRIKLKILTFFKKIFKSNKLVDTLALGFLYKNDSGYSIIDSFSIMNFSDSEMLKKLKFDFQFFSLIAIDNFNRESVLIFS